MQSPTLTSFLEKPSIVLPPRQPTDSPIVTGLDSAWRSLPLTAVAQYSGGTFRLTPGTYWIDSRPELMPARRLTSSRVPAPILRVECHVVSGFPCSLPATREEDSFNCFQLYVEYLARAVQGATR